MLYTSGVNMLDVTGTAGVPKLAIYAEHKALFLTLFVVANISWSWGETRLGNTHKRISLIRRPSCFEPRKCVRQSVSDDFCRCFQV